MSLSILGVTYSFDEVFLLYTMLYEFFSRFLIDEIVKPRLELVWTVEKSLSAN